jgi:hypothetical protein
MKIKESVVRSLADQYEHGNQNWIGVSAESIEELDDFLERYAELKASGVLNVRPGPEKKTLLCQFTDAGYREYAPLVKAARRLG